MSSKFENMVSDFRRYKELKKKLNPNNDSFIEVENTPDWDEFNALTTKLMPLFKTMGSRNVNILSDSIDVSNEIKELKKLN